jgi:uncharacterized damage-inducible protein DinB
MSNATQAAQFATLFEAVSDELIATVADCSDEQLRRTTASEEWPVAVVAHHLATVYRFFNGVLAGLAAEEMSPMAFGTEDVNRNNAQHARDFAAVGRPEALDALRTSRATLAQTLRSLGDEQFDRTAVVFEGNDLSAAQMVQFAIIAHTQEHLASIRATVAPNETRTPFGCA